jgi:hypothetical protein
LKKPQARKPETKKPSFDGIFAFADSAPATNGDLNC